MNELAPRLEINVFGTLCQLVTTLCFIATNYNPFTKKSIFLHSKHKGHEYINSYRDAISKCIAIP